MIHVVTSKPRDNDAAVSIKVSEVLDPHCDCIIVNFSLCVCQHLPYIQYLSVDYVCTVVLA